MIILPHPNIWVEYIKFKGKITPSRNFRRIFNILHNEENIFAYKYSWNEFYEEILERSEDDENDFVDVFNNIIVELNYNDKLIKEDFETIKTNHDFENCFDVSSQIQFLLLASSTNPYQIRDLKGVLILDKLDKPNKHWIYYSILISNQSQHQSVDYRDFNSDQEIQEFIKCILNLKNPINPRVYIQSDYLNYGTLFGLIVGKRITYCSSKYNNGINSKEADQLNTEKNSVQTYFGNNSQYWVSSDKKVLHPRAVFFNNIIITLNHDFPQISNRNSNWQITFHYCKQTYIEKTRIINSYTPV